MGRPKQIEDEDLLAVARAAFVEDGLSASTREIARRAGISEAAIFRRHLTKAHLFFAAMVPPAPDVRDLMAPTAADTDVVVQLERIALRILDYFREVIGILLPLMSHPDFDKHRFARHHPEAPFGAVHAGLVAWLEAERRSGRIADVDPSPAAWTLVATLHSMAHLEHFGVHRGPFDDGLVRSVVSALWTGLAPGPGADPVRDGDT